MIASATASTPKVVTVAAPGIGDQALIDRALAVKIEIGATLYALPHTTKPRQPHCRDPENQ